MPKLAKYVIVMLTCSMVVKVRLSLKDDGGLLTRWMRTRDASAYLKLLQMQFDVIPSSVYRRKMAEWDLIWFPRVSEAKEALRRRAGRRESWRFW